MRLVQLYHTSYTVGQRTNYTQMKAKINIPQQVLISVQLASSKPTNGQPIFV